MPKRGPPRPSLKALKPGIIFRRMHSGRVAPLCDESGRPNGKSNLKETTCISGRVSAHLHLVYIYIYIYIYIHISSSRTSSRIPMLLLGTAAPSERGSVRCLERARRAFSLQTDPEVLRNQEGTGGPRRAGPGLACLAWPGLAWA